MLRFSVATISQYKIHLPQPVLYSVYPLLQPQVGEVPEHSALASAQPSAAVHVALSAAGVPFAGHTFE